MDKAHLAERMLLAAYPQDQASEIVGDLLESSTSSFKLFGSVLQILLRAVSPWLLGGWIAMLTDGLKDAAIQPLHRAFYAADPNTALRFLHGSLGVAVISSLTICCMIWVRRGRPSRMAFDALITCASYLLLESLFLISCVHCSLPAPIYVVAFLLPIALPAPRRILTVFAGCALWQGLAFAAVTSSLTLLAGHMPVFGWNGSVAGRVEDALFLSASISVLITVCSFILLGAAGIIHTLGDERNLERRIS